nr:phospholipase A2 inhibitor and Ly6/PLAUR domain-containing protein-like [Anolis sagrei ordinatus]
MNPLFFYLFVALIGTGNCITCECTNCDTATTCETKTTESCYGLAVAHSLGSSPTTYKEQGCMPSSDCKDGSVSVTVGKGIYMRTNTRCCITNNCNTVPEVPKEDITVSKVECPSCFGLYPASCEPTMMTCAQSENQCINITGANIASIVQIPFSARGCASPSATNIQPHLGLTSGNTVYMAHTISLKTPSNSAGLAPGSSTFAILLPSLIGISFTKFLS